MIVTLAHARHAKYCNRGMRLWFAARGLSFAEFRKHGIDAEVLERTNDKQARLLIEIARNG